MSFKAKKISNAEMSTILGNNIGDFLRKHRDERCLTQEYLANELGIGQSAYQKIESGATKISIERLKQIADILGKHIDTFLNMASDNKPIDQKEVPPNFAETELLQKIILQQEKRIEELEEKVKRKDHKIEELKSILSQKSNNS